MPPRPSFSLRSMFDLICGHGRDLKTLIEQNAAILKGQHDMTQAIADLKTASATAVTALNNNTAAMNAAIAKLTAPDAGDDEIQQVVADLTAAVGPANTASAALDVLVNPPETTAAPDGGESVAGAEGGDSLTGGEGTDSIQA